MTLSTLNPPHLPATPREGMALVPTMLNHVAWVTHDVAATADFYTHILGMEIGSTVWDDSVPSTGESFPYFHIFFRMQDGSTIAFFESPGLPSRPEPSHPAYDVFDHFAMQVDSRDDVHRWRDWLVANGIEVVGPTDHNGLIYSIYFHDPNGIRLELTTPTDSEWNRHTEQGRKDLTAWVEAKERALASGTDVSRALTELIHRERARCDAGTQG